MRAALQLAGKLGGRGGACAIRPGNLIFIKDQASGASFLVDTGASVSLIPGPASPSSTAPPLSTADGSPLATGKERRTCLVLRNETGIDISFPWNFPEGEVAGPILGNDFLRAHGFCVDSASSNLRRLRTGKYSSAPPPSP